MIEYLQGDATEPVESPAIIAHCCNDIGGWGAGFVVALSNKWHEPEHKYREWATGHGPQLLPFRLGEVQVVPVRTDLWVANIIGQNGVRGPDNPQPVIYWALGRGLFNTFRRAYEVDASVHMPRLGCGLAGGKWDVVAELVDDAQRAYPQVKAYVYDL